MDPGRDGGPPAGVLEGSKAFVRSSAWASQRPAVGIPAREEGACALRGASRAASGALRLPHREQLAQGFAGVGACAHGACSSARGLAGVRFGALSLSPHSKLRHRIMEDYPLNLSISLSGGKETNRDAPSNGE